MRGLLAQEKKKVARVVGDTPIYDIVVGDGEGQVPLRKLSAHVMKLPRNLSAAEVNALGRRMSALGGAADAGARRPAARRPADVGQPAAGPPPRDPSSGVPRRAFFLRPPAPLVRPPSARTAPA